MVQRPERFLDSSHQKMVAEISLSIIVQSRAKDSGRLVKGKQLSLT